MKLILESFNIIKDFLKYKKFLKSNAKFFTEHKKHQMKFVDDMLVGEVYIPENADPTKQYSNLEPGSKFASLIMEKAYMAYTTDLVSDLVSSGMGDLVSVTDYEINPNRFIITVSFKENERIEEFKAKAVYYGKYVAILASLLILLSFI
jgi:hypothetical protein